jgi:hypothetical protein
VGGRIDAIGLSVVMPEGPRRIPGRLSVAPASPAVRKLSGSYIWSASAFRILAGACLSSRRNVRRTRSATARRCRYSCERRTGVSAPVRKRPRIRQRPSLSARRTMPKTFTGKPPIVAFGARVARVQRDSWDEALGPPAPVAGCSVARFAVPQDRYPKAILMPIRELMTSPSEKSPWRNRRSWTR